MIDPLAASLKIAGSGLEVQSHRVRVVSENLANIKSAGTAAGSDPYRRKTVSFESILDREAGISTVAIERIGVDRSAFPVEHDPSHPAADARGYVKLPNVNMLTEMADMREANRSYEANLQVMKQARQMISMTIDMLRSN